MAAAARRDLGWPARTRPPGGARRDGGGQAHDARQGADPGRRVGRRRHSLEPQGAAPGKGWQATAALGVLAGIVAFTGVCVLASALVAAPAFVAFLREGGWPKIRRRVAWAAGATVAAGGALAGLVLGQRSMSSAQLSHSWAYFIGVAATGLALVVALGLWASAAAATAKHLKLAPRARAAQLLLAAVTLTAALAIVSANIIWLAAIQSSLAWLVVGVANLAVVGVVMPRIIGRAVRKSRRLRATASGGRRLTRPLSGHTAVTSFDDLRGGLAGGPVGADRARGLQQQRQGSGPRTRCPIRRAAPPRRTRGCARPAVPCAGARPPLCLHRYGAT